MGEACSTYGGEERCIQGFGGETGGKETNANYYDHKHKLTLLSKSVLRALL